MKKTKQITSWDILDMIWAKWESFYGSDPEQYKSLSWIDLVNMVSPAGVKDFVKQLALEKFLFELKYVYRQPDRESMKHLWGEHVELYDVFACDKHRFVIVTSDMDGQAIEGQTVFCPHCNQDKFANEEKMNDYISHVGGRTETEQGYTHILISAKWHQKWQRRQARKYWMMKFFEKGYLQYRISQFFKSLFVQG